MEREWEFWIDVGGTFTDCIGRGPDGTLTQVKTLSSGATRGTISDWPDWQSFVDPSRATDQDGFWTGYRCRLLDAAGQRVGEAEVAAFHAEDARLLLDTPFDEPIRTAAVAYELNSTEEAPIVAIRRSLGLKLRDPIPSVRVRLGTTRGTNALLTRRGARTAFITTRGFSDILLIANQDRPRLFDLAIQKPEPLFEQVVEIQERLDANGEVLVPVDVEQVRSQLKDLQRTGVESIAICLLHSFANPAHELVVERVAREVGFREVSTSSRLSPLIKIVSRGDTTVVDAYLNPILREYVASLRHSLEARLIDEDDTHRISATEVPVRELRMMTSAGGLVDADRFVGKDSILSGPAGGVIGFSQVAQAAGFNRAIGFDMGGTSTDVSRFDGQYELEYETMKAGVRVVAPMLAIETVAAGGGSICGFDGVKLHVGPASAGADPGPACYGAGGPLTVTDLNVYLGHVLPEHFPFPLDRTAVQLRLEYLCRDIEASPMGRRYSPVELAEGFLAIANANMVRAIRRISVARGYDPADYVLVTFGGAGAQHACAMARELGIRRILAHPFSGILSAYGMGLADIRRFREQSLLRPWSTAAREELHTVFERLAEEARAEVLAERIPESQIRPAIRSVDVRYQGADSTLNIAWPDDGELQAAFEQQHRQLYGYVHTGRGLEITVARVEVVGNLPAPEWPLIDPVERIPEPRDTVTARFHGEDQTTSVFVRDDLHPGDRITGPAIICEATSTIVVEPGFVAELTARNDIILTDLNESKSGGGEPSTQGLDEPTAADPVMLEIFNNLFASIAEQMGVTLQQTSFSTNVKERLDFSCAVFSPTGDLVVNAPHIPVHLGAMSETVKRIIADNPDLAVGDVFVTNDPYRGGSHLPDVTVVTPVHHPETAELLFFTASRAHHAEIGGIVPGSMPPFSKNLAEEGVLIRNFRLVERGESREEALRELLTSGPWPTRCVHDNLADVAAQVAANNMGVRLLNGLVDRYSLPVVHAYMQHIQQAAAEKMRMALRRKGDGVYRFEDRMDDGATIRVAITIHDAQATVDFTGTDPVLPTNLNANRAITTAAVLYVFRCMIDEDIPLNSGVLDPITIVLPECFLNPPEHDEPVDCAAMVGGNVETSQRIVDTLLGALELAAASQGTMNNLTFGDGTFGYYETICGGSGATADADGADAVHTHMTNTRLTDVEVIERRYPVRVEEFRIRSGSGGSGRHRGGDGIVRRLRFLRPLQVSMLSQRRGENCPYGLANGSPGQPGENMLEPDRRLGGSFSLSVQPGDTLTIATPGGGGS